MLGSLGTRDRIRGPAVESGRAGNKGLFFYVLLNLGSVRIAWGASEPCFAGPAQGFPNFFVS